LRAAGKGGRFGANAGAAEKKMYSDNVARLGTVKKRVTRLKGLIAEARASSSDGVAALCRDLEAAVTSHDNLRDVILRQQSIKGMWVKPSATFVRLQSEESELVSRVASYQT
jgi:hypothetical protein